MALIVPYTRKLHLGSEGLDVLATKRALSRAGFMEWGDFTTTAGPNWQRALESFQKAHKLTVTGVYTTPTHTALRQAHRKGSTTQWAFDAPAIFDMREEAAQLKTTPDAKVRAQIVAAGFFWYAHRLQIAYAEWRPFAMVKPPNVPRVWDCSAYVTNCHYAGGAPNPNGHWGGAPRPWDGQGYTGTLMARGTRVAGVDQLEPGDLVFYGWTTRWSPAFPIGSPTHVAMYVGMLGRTPMVLSNGGHPMAYIPLGYRGINHLRHYAVT